MSRVVAGKRARLQPVAKDRRGAEQGGQWGKIVRLLQSPGAQERKRNKVGRQRTGSSAAAPGAIACPASTIGEIKMKPNDGCESIHPG
jgi:hypothetical protein